MVFFHLIQMIQTTPCPCLPCLQRMRNPDKLNDMKGTLPEITKAALALSDDEKVELAEKVVRSLVSHVPPAVKQQQLAEVMRRREDILSGKIEGVSAEQVIREIQDLVR